MVKVQDVEDMIGVTITTPGRTITESDVMSFAGLSGDFNQMHTNSEFAKSQHFGARVVHGMLTFSIMTGLWFLSDIFKSPSVVFYGIDKLRFTEPVFIGDTIKSVVKIETVESRGKSKLVTFEGKAVNQHNNVVVYSVVKYLLT